MSEAVLQIINVDGAKLRITDVSDQATLQIVDGGTGNVLVVQDATGQGSITINDDGYDAVLVLTEIGLQGPPGKDGGPPVLGEFLYPLSEWIVNHNLGWKPLVAVLSLGNVEVDAKVSHVTDNQLRVSFTRPFAGRVMMR